MKVFVAYIQYDLLEDKFMVDLDESNLGKRIMKFLNQENVTDFIGTLDEYMNGNDYFYSPNLYIWRSNGAVEIQ